MLLRVANNGAVEQCPGGASVSNSWFSRSGAEEESGVRCSTAPFSLRGAEGEPTVLPSLSAETEWLDDPVEERNNLFLSSQNENQRQQSR